MPFFFFYMPFFFCTNWTMDKAHNWFPSDASILSIRKYYYKHIYNLAAKGARSNTKVAYYELVLHTWRTIEKTGTNVSPSPVPVPVRHTLYFLTRPVYAAHLNCVSCIGIVRSYA
jgi:hypothetical protein